MTAQNLLSFFQESPTFQTKESVFDKHNRVFDNQTLQPLWKPWLTLELCEHLQQNEDVSDLTIDIKYKKNEQYLRVADDLLSVEDVDGRSASEADFRFTIQNKSVWGEVYYLNINTKDKAAAIAKLEQDYKRIETLRRALPKQEVIMLYGIYGRFTTKQLDMFKLLDNSSRTTYVLDSKLTGSTQISRLCQMQRAGKQRFLLAAF